MNWYKPSGIHNSSEMGQKFEFSTPGTSKLGNQTENITFSSLSKPRMVKSRKYLNSRSIGGLETRKIDPGINPFRPVSSNVVGGDALGVDIDGSGINPLFRPVLDGHALGGESSGLEYMNRNRHLKLKVANKDDKVGNELVDEIRKLKIENPNISSQSAREGVGGVGGELPIDLTRLNLRESGDVGANSFAFSATSKEDIVFGSSRTKVDDVDPVVDSTLPDKIKNLKLGEPGRRNDTQVERNAKFSEHAFVSDPSGVIDAMVLDEMEKLNIGGASEGFADSANLSESSSRRSSTDYDKSNCSENVSLTGEKEKHLIHPQVPKFNKSSGLSGTSVPLNSSFRGSHFQAVKGDQVPCSNDSEKREGFIFTGKQEGRTTPNVEFRTPESKGILFTGSNMNLEFCSKGGSAKVTMSRARKGKVKEPNPVLVFLAQNSSPMETSMQNASSDSYSPMDVSPYCETKDDAQSGGELSLTSNDSANEDLAKATECMSINEVNDLQRSEEKKHAMECCVNTDSDRASLVADCVSATQDVSFKSAVEDLGDDSESEVESKYKEVCEQTQYFSASSSISSGGSSFTFAASPSSHSQASASTRHLRKKNRTKAGPDICISPRTASMSDVTSSLQFSPFSRVSVLPSQVGLDNGVCDAPHKGGVSVKIVSPTSRTTGFTIFEDSKKGIPSPTEAARAAHEACEKWRLRGNQAYANGDLDKAEDNYTRGLSCVPQHETSKDCLRSLVLCYSNRAAARMSLGRMRPALKDCLVAVEIDPSFFRVQLRAANCYLSLGEIGDASRHFKNLLQSTDACVERKIVLEASVGLQKAQKVSECIDRSILLLRQRTSADVERALEIIAEALLISPYSEQLLECKAEALFMLRRHEETIQLCEQTLKAAENNASILCANELSSNFDDELLENYSFRTWRFGFVFKSNFYLGKLEEAFEFLEKQESWRTMLAKYGNQTVESLIPQLSTARQLLRHKSAGNGAFQTGRYTEAVEHYTAALSFNVESRPFTAVLFGNRAAAYQALGQITDAVADCSLAIALDGNYLKAISRRAALFEMIRDYDQAAKDLERLVSLLTKQAEEKPNPSRASLPIGSLADLRQARQRLSQMEEHAKRGVSLNFYLILGVEPSVKATDLKKGYRKAALRHHPDKAVQSLARSECGDDGLWKEIAEEVYKDADKLFKMIGEAYAVLSDPTKRTQYDIDEEARNGWKKNSNMSRMPNDASNHAEKKDGVGRQWRESWRSPANPYSRGFEPTRPGRYY